VGPEGVERKLAAILSADVVGYSRLMAEDEAGTIRTLTDYREEIAMLVRQHRGRVVDSPGDNLLAEFPTALDAVQTAVEVQRVIGVRTADLPAERRMQFRVGVHLGDIATEGERVYGEGVNIAARLESLAEPGGVCISAEVQGQVRHKLELGFHDLGDQSVKNIPEPVHVYRVEIERGAVASKVQRTGRRRGALAAAAVLIVALLGTALWRYFAPSEGERGVSPTGSLPTAIAVLPFADMSRSHNQEYFADGMAEEIINALSKVGGLRVVARTSAFAFKGKNEDIRTIGKQLNVGAVVEGSVRKADDRLRITAQLVRVSDGFHIWSETYDRKLDDVFAIQDEIARATVEALRVRLASTEPLVKRPTADLQAYELYLTGRHFWNQRTEEGLRKAIEYFEQALQGDPNYALVYTGLADSYAMLWGYGYDRSEEVLSKAVSAAMRALAIDETSGEAHASLGWLLVIEWRWEEAEKELQRALQLNAGYPFTHDWYADLLSTIGRDEEALREYRRALELDPLSPVINRDLGWHYFRAGDYDAAIEPLRTASRLNPDDPFALDYLSRALAERGREEEAFEVFLSQDISPEIKADYREVYQVSGYRAVQRTALELRIEQTGKKCTDRPFEAAVVLGYLGEEDRMLQCLQEGVRLRQFARNVRNPWLDKYRSDPQFIAILAQTGLKE
jgi:TolB-like protein/class 3 adenylate cyclase/Tfp pilus assembly protein PilF